MIVVCKYLGDYGVGVVGLDGGAVDNGGRLWWIWWFMLVLEVLEMMEEMLVMWWTYCCWK